MGCRVYARHSRYDVDARLVRQVKARSSGGSVPARTATYSQILAALHRGVCNSDSGGRPSWTACVSRCPCLDLSDTARQEAQGHLCQFLDRPQLLTRAATQSGLVQKCTSAILDNSPFLKFCCSVPAAVACNERSAQVESHCATAGVVQSAGVVWVRVRDRYRSRESSKIGRPAFRCGRAAWRMQEDSQFRHAAPLLALRVSRWR